MSTLPIPVTVLTGFLGSGKTTLLNKILAAQHGKKIAVIENEFGEVGVDNQLVIEADEEIFEMNNGCICCTVRGDLIRILTRLAKRPERLDGVIIETTGLANPGPVALTFFSDPEIRKTYQLDAIVTLIDAFHIQQHWENSDEARKQIAFADVILLNKTDLVPAYALDVVEQQLRKLNSAARIHRTTQADITLGSVLNVGGFNLDRATAIDPQFLEPEYPFEWGGVFEIPSKGVAFHLEAGPDPEMKVALIAVPSADTDAIAKAVEKAVLAYSGSASPTAPDETVTADAGACMLDLENAPAKFLLKPTKGGLHALFSQHHPDEFSAVLKFRQRVLDPVWSHNFKPNHSHDEAVGSVGISLPGELDSRRLNEWLAKLLREKGADIFRSKGVLAIRGSAQRLVFQGVHMMFDSRFDRPWGEEPRVNTFVFIGRNLDHTELVEGFKACLVG